MPFEIVHNDIANIRVDTMVNTANPKPMIGFEKVPWQLTK